MRIIAGLVRKMKLALECGSCLKLKRVAANGGVDRVLQVITLLDD
jgi:hypothetical protein